MKNTFWESTLILFVFPHFQSNVSQSQSPKLLSYYRYLFAWRIRLSSIAKLQNAMSSKKHKQSDVTQNMRSLFYIIVVRPVFFFNKNYSEWFLVPVSVIEFIIRGDDVFCVTIYCEMKEWCNSIVEECISQIFDFEIFDFQHFSDRFFRKQIGRFCKEPRLFPKNKV